MVRTWLWDAFKVRIEREGNRCYMVDHESTNAKVQTLIACVEAMQKKIDVVQSCATSLEQTGTPMLMPAKAQLFLEANAKAQQLSLRPDVNLGRGWEAPPISIHMPSTNDRRNYQSRRCTDFCR